MNVAGPVFARRNTSLIVLSSPVSVEAKSAINEFYIGNGAKPEAFRASPL